jgi:ketosteroid isomerase-like protein
MSDESTTPDLLELVRQSVDAANVGEIDELMAFYATDAVWDMSSLGMGTFEGQAAVRGFLEDWFVSYEAWGQQLMEVEDLGNGVTLALLVQKGRPVGSSGEVELRYAAVGKWEDGMIVRTTVYADVDEARAAAERLAEERG